MATDFKQLEINQFIKLDLKHRINNNITIESIFCEFISVNYSDENPDYIESITVNQIISIELYFLNLKDFKKILRTIDYSLASSANVTYFTNTH